jgi:hypothetical protein
MIFRKITTEALRAIGITAGAPMLAYKTAKVPAQTDKQFLQKFSNDWLLG